jgi:hypothetical protein
MNDLPATLREQIIRRADQRCEYCKLSQLGQEAAFHIDHVHPRSKGGTTTIENLALACVACSLHKAAKDSAVDPDTGQIVALFNPRLQIWSDHFQWDSVVLVGRTPTGRATAVALKMNRPLILGIRAQETIRNRHPFAEP